MGAHQRHTAFLRHIIRYDATDECHELEERIAEVQRDEHCVERAAWLMALSAALSLVALGCVAVLVDNFSEDWSHFALNAIFALGVGSLISLVAFVGLLTVYRQKSHQLHEECRQLASRFLETRLGKPSHTKHQSRHRKHGNHKVPQGAGKAGDARGGRDSSRQVAGEGEAKSSP